MLCMLSGSELKSWHRVDSSPPPGTSTSRRSPEHLQVPLQWFPWSLALTAPEVASSGLAWNHPAQLAKYHWEWSLGPYCTTWRPSLPTTPCSPLQKKIQNWKGACQLQGLPSFTWPVLEPTFIHVASIRAPTECWAWLYNSKAP